MLAVLATIVMTQRGSTPQVQFPKPGAGLKFVDAEFTVKAKARSASYVLQSNPSGVAELLAANGRSSSFAYILPQNSSRRSSNTFRPMAATQIHSRTGNPRAFRADFNVGKLLSGSGVDIAAESPKVTIDFGVAMSNEPKPTRSVSFTKVSTGKVTYSISGSQAFRVSVAKAVEYVEGSDFGSGYEKTVEWTSSPFSASSGSQVTFYLEFNQSLSPGPQVAVLTITDGPKKLSYTLKGDVVAKQLSVNVNQVTQSTSAISPQERVDATVNMTVLQNTGSNLGFKLVEAPAGFTLSGSDKWVGTAGAASHKLSVQTDASVPDTASQTLTVAIYRGDTQQTLATFPITFSVTRKWLEWSYKRSTGKQDVWGVLQVANTGEFIWNVHAYNWSSVFSDQFFTAICFPGITVGGRSPAVFTVGALPIGSHDTCYYQFTGKMPISDFSALGNELLHSYLGIHEGGPLAALAGAGEGFVDLLKQGFGGSDYDNIPNTFGGKAVKWLNSKQAKAVQLSSAKFWL